MTSRQAEAVQLMEREGRITPQRLAGEYGLRAQDAGRILRALERQGVATFYVGFRDEERVNGLRCGWQLTGRDG